MKEQILAVQRMQDYIGQHLFEKISLAELAEASMLSPWYAHRMFKSYIGLAPADYIRKLRLSKAALRLRDESVRIIDVAYDCGFESVDGFQRAFYKEFSYNPKEYAMNPMPISLFIPYGVKSKELYKEERTAMENIKSVFIQIIEKPARKVIIKRGSNAEDYMAYCQEVGCDIWGILTSMKSLCGEPVCMWLPNKYRKPNTSHYVQGVEVATDYSGTIPEGFDVVELPAAKYMMFQGEPFEEEDYCEAIVAVQTAMNQYNPSVVGYTWDDENPRIQLEPIGTRGYIELRAVK